MLFASAFNGADFAIGWCGDANSRFCTSNPSWAESESGKAPKSVNSKAKKYILLLIRLMINNFCYDL